MTTTVRPVTRLDAGVIASFLALAAVLFKIARSIALVIDMRKIHAA